MTATTDVVPHGSGSGAQRRVRAIKGRVIDHGRGQVVRWEPGRAGRDEHRGRGRATVMERGAVLCENARHWPIRAAWCGSDASPPKRALAGT